MKVSIKKRIEAAKLAREAKKLRKNKPRKRATPIVYREPEPLKIQKLHEHPRWSEIQMDIVSSALSAPAICRKYSLRTQHGGYAITQILSYRHRVKDKYPNLYAALGEMEQKALLHEYTELVRSSVALAQDTRMLASDRKLVIGKKGEERVVESPDFMAMLGAEKNQMDAIDKFREIVGVGLPQPVQVTQSHVVNNNRLTLMAMPKQVGVATKAIAAPQAKVEDAIITIDVSEKSIV